MKYTVDSDDILFYKTSEREALNYLAEEMQPCITAINRTNRDNNQYNRIKEIETIRDFLDSI